MNSQLTEFLKLNKEELMKPVPEINWQSLYLKLDENLRSQFTELMLSKKIDPSLYLKNIPKKYLYNSNIDKYAILDHIEEIRSQAFSNCKNLISITIPNSVISICESAFYKCRNLLSITIPNSVTSIDDNAFDNCISLTNINIPNSVTSIESHVFYNCTSLKNVTIGNGVTSIGYCAFGNCRSLESITIPDSVTSIRDYAFENCGDKLVINYEGTKADWKKIYNSQSFKNTYFTVNCIDGKIIKKRR